MLRLSILAIAFLVTAEPAMSDSRCAEEVKELDRFQKFLEDTNQQIAKLKKNAPKTKVVSHEELTETVSDESYLVNPPNPDGTPLSRVDIQRHEQRRRELSQSRKGEELQKDRFYAQFSRLECQKEETLLKIQARWKSMAEKKCAKLFDMIASGKFMPTDGVPESPAHCSEAGSKNAPRNESTTETYR